MAATKIYVSYTVWGVRSARPTEKRSVVEGIGSERKGVGRGEELSAIENFCDEEVLVNLLLKGGAVVLRAIFDPDSALFGSPAQPLVPRQDLTDKVELNEGGGIKKKHRATSIVGRWETSVGGFPTPVLSKINTDIKRLPSQVKHHEICTKLRGGVTSFNDPSESAEPDDDKIILGARAKPLDRDEPASPKMPKKPKVKFDVASQDTVWVSSPD
ncbi:hypothetical protein B0H17DRAFT_1128550 [Mycena rosella]|uniref:Uncharacterized protein n=1 Tax=Mycena rosella TaxID=1033263 RepID=A0AAD7DY42_MYCRO|nr:hypothetical protein B0H17DRAFT_1128550 [Mycena rosella]